MVLLTFTEFWEILTPCLIKRPTILLFLYLRVVPGDGLDAGHDVVHGDEVGVLGHGEALLRLAGNVQLGHQELDGTTLDEDGEEDHDQRGEEEDVVQRLVLLGVERRDEDDQGEPHGAPEAAVGHDELLLEADPVHPPLVDQEGQRVDADEPARKKSSLNAVLLSVHVHNMSCANICPKPKSHLKSCSEVQFSNILLCSMRSHKE